MRQFDSKEWLHLVQQERITNAFLVPTMLKRLLDEPDLDEYDLSSLETLSYGAAPMPVPVIRRAIEKLPKSIGFINAFGQTETTSTVTMLLPEDHRLDGPPEEVEKKLKRLSSIGRPLPDVEIRIVNDEGREVARGEIGEIILRTSRLMKGYIGQDTTTQEILVDGWIHTRDLGWIDDDGYLYLAGRRDDLIIRGGENIDPSEIEAVLHSHPAIEEAAVIGYPSEEWGEIVMAVVVPKKGATITAEDLTEFCRQRLASFKKPERVEFAESLPRNALGKVIRKDLKARYLTKT
jgi:acyl-CoA synthetase (AMP-forming)/AMP-acid ligase II